MAYLDFLAEECCLLSHIQTLRCPDCRAYAFIPHASRRTFPMIWCHCHMPTWQYLMYRNYAKYQ